MRDKRYPAFLLVSIALLAVFLIRNSTVLFGNPSVPPHAMPPSTPQTGPVSVPISKETAPAPGPSIPVFPLDINKATAEDFTLLPGIGEKTALRIVEKRAEMNGFRTVDDLTEVKWVGKVKLERIRGLIFAGPTDKATRSAP